MIDTVIGMMGLLLFVTTLVMVSTHFIYQQIPAWQPLLTRRYMSNRRSG